MARWAGVQKVSRPIVRCQEMSQVTPTITLVEAKRTAYRNHGTVPETVPAHSSRASTTYAGVAMASIIDDMAYVKRIAGPVEDATVSDEQLVISRLGARTVTARTQAVTNNTRAR